MDADDAGANPWLRPAAAVPPPEPPASEAADAAVTAARQVGRPRLAEKRADGDRVPVRLTRAERARVEAAARAAGFGRVAPFMRSVVLAAVDGAASAEPPGDRPGVDGRVLSNLNQIARGLNTAVRAGQGVEDELLHRTLAAVEAVAEQVAAL